MSQNQTATKTARRLFPLEGTLSNIRRLNGAKGEYVLFTFAYGVTGRDGARTVQTRTGKAFGGSVAAIAPALVEGGLARLLCEFDSTPQGQTVKAVKIAPPRKEAQAA